MARIWELMITFAISFTRWRAVKRAISQAEANGSQHGDYRLFRGNSLWYNHLHSIVCAKVMRLPQFRLKG